MARRTNRDRALELFLDRGQGMTLNEVLSLTHREVHEHTDIAASGMRRVAKQLIGCPELEAAGLELKHNGRAGLFFLTRVESVESGASPGHQPPTLPTWYRAPSSDLTLSGICARKRVGHEVQLFGQLVKRLRSGHLVLPPWQRSFVWTTKQQIQLFESIVDFTPLPSLVFWQPPPGELPVGCRPFAGVAKAAERPVVVLDGQQRLTTMLRAAQGKLAYYWQNDHWSPDCGSISLEAACEFFPHSLFHALHGRSDELTQVLAVHERIRDSMFHATVLEDHTLEDAVETYSRMARQGNEHSSEDLAPLDAWLKTR
jgi:hypothetical protein